MLLPTSAFSVSDLTHKWPSNKHFSFYTIECTSAGWILPLIVYIVIAKKKKNPLVSIWDLSTNAIKLPTTTCKWIYHSAAEAWKTDIEKDHQSTCLLLISFLLLHYILYPQLLCRTDEPLIWLFFWYAAIHQDTGIHSGFYSWCLQIYLFTV